MPFIERTIRLTLENVPVVMFAAALIGATLFSGIPGAAERYLSWFLLTAVGLQGIWAGATHVFFPETGARYIGWKTSPFQFELGVADLAIGIVAVLSFWQSLPFKAAVVAYISLFYLGVSIGHIRDRLESGNREKGNFGALFGMTVIKSIGLPILLWLALDA